MSKQTTKVLLTIPKDLHSKLKAHAATEMRSVQRQVIYILEQFASEKKLKPAEPAVNSIDLDLDSLEFTEE